MRLLKLIETVNSDQIKHDKADEIINAFYSYVKSAIDSDQPKKFFVPLPNGKDFGIYTKSIPNMPDFAHDLILQFFTKESGMDGEFKDLRNAGKNYGASFAIFFFLGHMFKDMWSNNNLSEALQYILTAPEIKNTMYHELIHYLDYQEHVSPGDTTQGDGHINSDRASYHNDRWEQNAYFMMLAEPLLKIRGALNSHDYHRALALSKNLGLTDSFDQVMNNIMNTRSEDTRESLLQAMQWLKEPKQKRYITRLYKIYADIKKHILDNNNT